MARGVEGGSRLPESLVTHIKSFTERGRRRFSLNRVVVSAALGGIAAPLSALALGYAVGGDLSKTPSSDYPIIAAALLGLIATGIQVGALFAANTRHRS